MNPICNHDCFHCPYEDCINDELLLEDYQVEKEIDLLSGAREYKTPKAIRARNKEYYEENKEKVAAARKKYYEENKEKWKEYHKKSRQKKSSLALARSVGGKEK